jgi:LacI family transcriptional regulator
MSDVSRRPTISDVARRAGVSVATVSRVLRGAEYLRPSTAAAVRSAIDELGYRPSAVARSMRTQATNTIGLIVPDLLDPFFPELVDGADAEASALGYSIILGGSASTEARALRYLHLMVDQRVDGLIIAAAQLPAGSHDWLAGIPVPVVAVNAEAGDFAETSITSDNEGGARLAAEHLIELGHRRIAYLRGPADIEAARHRQNGFRAACDAAGLDPEETPVTLAHPSMRSGELAAMDILERAPRTTAIATYSDQMAVGALRALRAAGKRVPQDVSVIGFDDIITAAWMWPSLTTVAQQKHEMGRMAVQHIVQLLQDPSAPRDVQHVRLPMSLVVRESTGRAQRRAARRGPGTRTDASLIRSSQAPAGRRQGRFGE